MILFYRVISVVFLLILYAWVPLSVQSPNSILFFEIKHLFLQSYTSLNVYISSWKEETCVFTCGGWGWHAGEVHVSKQAMYACFPFVSIISASATFGGEGEARKT